MSEALFAIRATGDGLFRHGENLRNECEELRLATTFSLPTRRPAEELDPKERTELGEGL